MCDVHDLLIDLDAPEPPIMDGSAAPFLEGLRSAGFRDQPGTVKVLTLRGPVRVSDGESSYEAWPSQSLELDGPAMRWMYLVPFELVPR